MGFWAELKEAGRQGRERAIREREEKEAKEAEEKRKAEEERIAKEKAEAEEKARVAAMTPEERKAWLAKKQAEQDKRNMWAWRANPEQPDWAKQQSTSWNQVFHTFGTDNVDMAYRTYAPAMYGMLMDAARSVDEIREFRAEYRENQKKLENDIAEIKEKIEMLSEILSKMTESSIDKERKY